MPLAKEEKPPTTVRLSDPERWVGEYGDYLFKYALVRLRDSTKAEDMVQETFLAALKGGSSFAGKSKEKSWLVGILKNKICDYYRKASRETSFTDMEFYSDEESDRFIPDGIFQGGKLPKNVATVFTLREVDGVESKEICALLNISENNLWVMLHRARMALRRCLEANWFAKQNVPE